MKSVGSLLLSARKSNGYTIEEVNRAIKIHPKYIKALESDDYSLFEGRVHAKGFLKNYAEFLELDQEEIMALWRREHEPSLEDKRGEKFTKIKALEPEKFIITPGLVISIFSAVLLSGFFAFLFFQYKAYTDAPSLDLFYPEDNMLSENDIVDITGRVELDSEVFINNQRIINNSDGSFLTSIKLREGINTISVKAVNKLNKETEIIRTIIFRPTKEMPLFKPTEELDGSGDAGPLEETVGQNNVE